ncbi:hypothetical protein D3C76_1386410 [compost metagenome]
MGGGIDDQVRLECLHVFTDAFGLGQVELITTQHMQLAKVAQALLQRLGNLAVLAADEDVQSACGHGNRSASFSHLPAWSLADSCGAASSCQSMARSGSSQRMQRSAAGL